MSRILVIEDEPDMREGLRYNLEYEGHEVAAGDG
jgi:DNA-binding response OmpR family regulator